MEGASETLEQVSADFALSQLAARLGKTKHSQTLLERSSYWKNLYNPKATKQLGYIQGAIKTVAGKTNSTHLVATCLLKAAQRSIYGCYLLTAKA